MDAESARSRMIAINGYREEAARLEALGLLRLDGETRANIRRYHDEVLEDMGAESGENVPLPVHWGMRAVATAGALVLVVLGLWSLDSLWPDLGTVARLAIALALPAGFWILTEALYAAFPSRYPATVAATLAALSLGGALMVTAAEFNHSAGIEALLLGGAGGAVLGLRLCSLSLAGAGLVVSLTALGAVLALADGAVTGALWMRPDVFAAVGIAAFLAGIWSRPAPPLPAAFRMSGLLIGGFALAGLSLPGAGLLCVPSYVWPLGGVLLVGLAFAVALRRDWPETRALAPGLLALIGASTLWQALDETMHDTAAWLLAGLALALLAGGLTLLRRWLESRP